MSDKKTITRRQFIKETTAAAIGGTLLLGTPAAAFSTGKESKTAKVVLVRNKDVLDVEGQPKAAVVREMLDSAVMELTGKKTAADAWGAIIKPTDIVGIKTNVWSPIGTTKEVEQALKKGVMTAGVAEKNISIKDRGLHSDPFFKKTTALINARPMRAHHWSGVGSLIKNYITFVPDPYNYHGDSCADLGKIWHMEHAAGKTRLNVLVMLTPQFHGVGPHSFSPRYVWRYNGFLVGFDPVAVDSVGIRLFQAKRKEFFKGDRPLNPPPKHIFLADTRYNLGTADPNKIKLVKLGYDKDILI